MTSYSSANFPTTGSNIPNSLEKELMRLIGAFHNVQGNTRYQEREASNLDSGYEPIAVSMIVDTPNGPMYIGRVAIPVSSSWETPDTGFKPWSYAQERVTGPFPSRYAG